jgi:hypothetical protein
MNPGAQAAHRFGRFALKKLVLQPTARELQ